MIDETDVGAPTALDRLDRLDAAPDTESRHERRARRRNERWERPVVRDWRWAVRAVGRTLIILGVLMFGFAAYQVWGTGIETARAQNRLENQFEDMLAEYQADDLIAGGPTTTRETNDAGAPPAGNDPGREPEEPDELRGDRIPDGDGTGQGDAAAEPSGRHDTVRVGDGPIRRELPPLAPGDPLGKVEIPKIGLDFMIVEGVSTSDLKTGIGHFPDTPQPGQLGNSGLAGHRTTYGNPLLNADRLEPGDRVTVTTLAGTFVYNITESFVVSPSDSWVVATEDDDVAMLTIITCDPAWTARDRLVVRAELDPEASDTVFVADPVDETTGTDTTGDQSPDGEGGVDDPFTSDEAGDDVAAGGDNDRGGSGPVGDAERVVTPEGELDAFEQGWFSDSGAYAHVALWAAALMAIGAIGYFVSRFFRRYWVGTLVCAAPFLVTLYFFYQNVNRLLPPAL